jgi:hypothetical protein
MDQGDYEDIRQLILDNYQNEVTSAEEIALDAGYLASDVLRAIIIMRHRGELDVRVVDEDDA